MNYQLMKRLAEGKFAKQICTRSGYHKYNVALISSMIAEHGVMQQRTGCRA
ncbi:MAG: hypothetical protein Ct9H300mP28_12190 [Pseudomonadota bacterium]|nr:MAG: hypothetical protein Ct9H300mP28_12190 [Pseudomonadota bacterium]